LKETPRRSGGVRKKFESLEGNGEKALKNHSRQETAFTPISSSLSGTAGSTRFYQRLWNTSKE